MKPKLIALIAIPVVLVSTGFVGLIYGRLFVFNYHKIPQAGMYPGLPAGSRLLSWRNPYSTPSDVKRGDVVLYAKTIDGQAYKIVWRVIGLPGDDVVIDGEKVVINGASLKRERLRDDGDFIIYREFSGDAVYEVAYPHGGSDLDQPKASLKVPENTFYLLGDNRFNALDSRFDGPISFDSIVGKKIGD